MTQVLLIHGINNEKNSKQNIENTWIDALSVGVSKAGGSIPNDVSFRAAFYGDVLKAETDSWGQRSSHTSKTIPEQVSENYSEMEIYDLYRAYQHAFSISDNQLLGYLEASESEKSILVEGAGIHKGWLKAIVRALEDTVPTKGKFLARIFLKQAAAYLQKPLLKEEIDSLVYEQVFEGLSSDENTIIISHSLGTIVGYSILRALEETLPVSLFITAGSPLGIDIVKKRLGPPLIRPNCVKTWLNAADPDDFVALHKQLNVKTFGVSEIVNISNLDNGHSDPHDILKYLSNPKVAEYFLQSVR